MVVVTGKGRLHEDREQPAWHVPEGQGLGRKGQHLSRKQGQALIRLKMDT